MKKILLTTAGILLIPWLRLQAKPNTPGSDSDHPIISRVKIVGTNIFDFESMPYLKKFPYTWINTLHIQTKEYIIQNELLMKPGDRYDEFLHHETERNLRALPFIRAARIAKYPQRDGTIALVVYVSDSWTTEPQINLSGINGISSVEFGFKEKNFLGYGKLLKVFYKTDASHRVEREIGYSDPNILGSHWQLNTDGISASDGHSTSLELTRPFYSAITPWSATLKNKNEVKRVSDYNNGEKVATYDQTQETYDFGGGIKLGHGKSRVNHAGLRYERQRLDYEPSADTPGGYTLPTNNNLQTVFLDLDTRRNNYKEFTKIEKMTRIEDINLGDSLSVSPGLSPRSLTGTPSSTKFGMNFDKYTLWNDKNLLRTSAVVSSRNTLEKPENSIFTFDLKNYRMNFHEQTLVTHARLDWGHKLDPDNLIPLGSQNGLRAFGENALIGNRSLLFNVEDRLYFFDDLFQLLSIGGAVFYDTGNSWTEGQSPRLRDMNSDVGAGFRFGLTKSASEVIIRLDFAYRLQRIHAGDPKFVVMFGTDQAF